MYHIQRVSTLRILIVDYFKFLPNDREPEEDDGISALSILNGPVEVNLILIENERHEFSTCRCRRSQLVFGPIRIFILNGSVCAEGTAPQWRRVSRDDNDEPRSERTVLSSCATPPNRHGRCSLLKQNIPYILTTSFRPLTYIEYVIHRF